MEFFFDSHLDPMWTVIVYANRSEAFRVQGNDWEGLMEDLTHSVPGHLSDCYRSLGSVPAQMPNRSFAVMAYSKQAIWMGQVAHSCLAIWMACFRVAPAGRSSGKNRSGIDSHGVDSTFSRSVMNRSSGLCRW
jgi:hypothetical protein